MKPIEQIREECKHASIMTIDEFIGAMEAGYISPYDGIGYYHDGEKETEVKVEFWKIAILNARYTYPYICWYNK